MKVTVVLMTYVRLLAMILVIAGVPLTMRADVADCDSLSGSAPVGVLSLPVTSVYAVEIGKISILDTYLSPLEYTGTSVALSGLWKKAMPFDPVRWTMNFDADIRLARTLNPAKLASEYMFSTSFLWGMNRRWQLPFDIQLSAGASAGISAGVIYLPKNSNNPASAKCSVSLALQTEVSRKFSIGRLPVVISDRVYLPSLSVFFSPQFGESYYEIYLGNHSGLAHCGWWGNFFCIDNIFAVDLDFGKTAMRVGYRFNVRSSYVSDINSKIMSHMFVIGVIPHGLGLKKVNPSQITRRIYAVY